MTFGAVFKYLDKEYVFLVETPEIIYAARILSVPDTEKLEKRYTQLEAQNLPNLGKMSVYSYVVLETTQLKRRAAHFHGTDSTIFSELIPLNITLNKEDLIRIKDEITKDGCVSTRLKEKIKDIEI